MIPENYVSKNVEETKKYKDFLINGIIWCTFWNFFYIFIFIFSFAFYNFLPKLAFWNMSYLFPTLVFVNSELLFKILNKDYDYFLLFRYYFMVIMCTWNGFLISF
jgi:hypothetical protein